jgi:hypothetical protein
MEAIAKSAGSTVQATDVIMENPMLTGGTRAKVVGTASLWELIKCLHQ